MSDFDPRIPGSKLKGSVDGNMYRGPEGEWTVANLTNTESFVANGIRWVRESAMYQAMEQVADTFHAGVIADYRRDKEELTDALAEAKEAKDSKWCWRIGNALGVVNPSIETAESAIVSLRAELAEAKSRSLAAEAMLEVVNGDLRWVEGETLPQARRDLAKANEKIEALQSELAEAKSLLTQIAAMQSRLAQELGHSGKRPADWDDLLSQVAYWRRLDRKVSESKASPSLSDVKSPKALRFAADVIERHWRTMYGQLHPHTAVLRKRADCVEREQAAKTAQDHAIEQAAHVLIWPQQGITWDAANEPQRKDARVVAGHLAKAGLLNTKHGEA